MKVAYFVDWLELYCIRMQGTDISDNLRAHGLKVEKMPYTTRVYEEVLNVYSQSGEFLCTICQHPLSVKDGGCNGVMDSRACHIKLHNHLLYRNNVGRLAKKLCSLAGVSIRNVSRIDICADFQYFRCGMKPESLLKGFLAERYNKVGQPRFSVHGTAEKGYNYYTSMSFGSKSSCVFSRIYDKTIEMQEVGMKTWIVDAWRSLGFDVDSRHMWRVEFEIHGPGRNNLDKHTGEVKAIDVDDLNSADYIRRLFISLSKKYFVFTDASTASRKYNQKHLDLFDYTDEIQPYQLLPNSRTGSTNRTTKQVYTYLREQAERADIYSEDERVRLLQAADSIGSHYSLRQWISWKFCGYDVEIEPEPSGGNDSWMRNPLKSENAELNPEQESLEFETM